MGEKTKKRGNPKMSILGGEKKPSREEILEREYEEHLLAQYEARIEEEEERQIYYQKHTKIKKTKLSTNPINTETKILNLLELMEMDTSCEYLIENLLVKGSICLISGKPSCTKTFFCIDLGLSCALCRKFLGKYDAKPAKVLYIDKDNGSNALARRFQKMLNKEEIKNLIKENEEFKQAFKIIFQETLRFNPEGETKLYRLMEEHQPDIVVIDSLIRFIEGDENDSIQVSQIFEILRRLTEKFNTTFILIHHNNKSEKKGMNSIRGSGDIVAGADMIYTIEKKELNEIILTQIKNRFDEEIKPIQYALKSKDFISLEFVKELKRNNSDKFISKPEQLAKNMKEWIVNHPDAIFTTEDYRDAISEKTSPNTLYSSLNKLKEWKYITNENLAKGEYKILKKE